MRADGRAPVMLSVPYIAGGGRSAYGRKRHVTDLVTAPPGGEPAGAVRSQGGEPVAHARSGKKPGKSILEKRRIKQEKKAAQVSVRRKRDRLEVRA